MSRRAVGLWTCVCAVVWMAGCSVDTVMEPNVEAQFAKGGNGGGKGKTGDGDVDSGTPPVLREFWVYSERDTESGKNVDWVHMVVEGGDADFIGNTVVYDHFFNGYRDLVDQHYEYYSPQGAPTPTPEVLEEEAPIHTIHTDLLFEGNRATVDSKGVYPFPKYYTAVVEVEDGIFRNPFTFVVYAYEEGTRLATWWPRGVIYEGQTGGPGPVEDDLQGAGHLTKHASVRSYATWGGETLQGETLLAGDIWVEKLLLESNVSCSTGGSKGKGKKQTSGGNAVITGTIAVTFGRLPLLDDDALGYWWEGHFYDVGTGALSASRVGTTDGTWTFSLEMPDGWTGTEIAFVVDYLYPIGSLRDLETSDSWAYTFYAYNPDLNRVDTWVHNTLYPLAGERERWSNSKPSTEAGDKRYPLAQSQTRPVTCN